MLCVARTGAFPMETGRTMQPKGFISFPPKPVRLLTTLCIADAGILIRPKVSDEMMLAELPPSIKTRLTVNPLTLREMTKGTSGGMVSPPPAVLCGTSLSSKVITLVPGGMTGP